MPKRPNVVFILTDDQGAWAMGCAGNSDVQTPNLDRIAATGTRFENFFCVSPVCSPARASLLTGRLPSQHGVHDWIRSGNIDADRLNTDIQNHPQFRDELKPVDYLAGHTAYTDILAANDYRLGLSGKWHLGDNARARRGFSHWFTIAQGGCHYDNPPVVRNGEIGFEGRYVTDLITEEALTFLDAQERGEQPFYLSVHYTAPHTPWGREEHPAEVWDLYGDCAFDATPDKPLHPWQIRSCEHGTGERRKELLRGYYTAITAMDRGVGRLLDKLEVMGLREDTFVFFTSDNGMNAGHHGIWGKGNGTFPLNMFDTSVKVPGLASMPGRIPAGRVCADLLSHYDFAPSLLEFLGIDDKLPGDLPGHSFAPLLDGTEGGPERPVVVFDEYGPVRMIRTREWKYVHRYPYGPHELYDLGTDPGEEVNLFSDKGHEERIQEMGRALNRWFLQYVDPACDGTHEAVHGSGQLNLCGEANPGTPAFAGPHQYADGSFPEFLPRREIE